MLVSWFGLMKTTAVKNKNYQRTTQPQQDTPGNNPSADIGARIFILIGEQYTAGTPRRRIQDVAQALGYDQGSIVPTTTATIAVRSETWATRLAASASTKLSSSRGGSHSPQIFCATGPAMAVGLRRAAER